MSSRIKKEHRKYRAAVLGVNCAFHRRPGGTCAAPGLAAGSVLFPVLLYDAKIAVQYALTYCSRVYYGRKMLR